MKKKLVSLLLCGTMLFSEAAVVSAAEVESSDVTGYAVELDDDDCELSVLNATTEAPTQVEAYEKIMDMQKYYPNGTPWDNGNYYAWKGGIYSGGYGCAGFAFMLSDAAFGDLPATRTYDVVYDNLKVGDILRVGGDTHSVIITEVTGDYIIVAEGNYNSVVHWGRKITKSEVLDTANYVLTRYPEGAIETKVTNITLDASKVTLEVSEVFELVAKVYPLDASTKSLNWSSSDESVAVVDNDGSVTAVGEGSAIITAKSKDGSNVSAICEVTVAKSTNHETVNPFADVAQNDNWQYEYVKYVYDRGLMTGKKFNADGKVVFDADAQITRAELVQILYSYAGKPAVEYNNVFTDVQSGQWFTDAIAWAEQNGIVAGKTSSAMRYPGMLVEERYFDPDQPITRQEIAVILLSYARKTNMYDIIALASLENFSDEDMVSDWAKESVQWAVYQRIITGRGNKIDPTDYATRAEVAAMLKGFIGTEE